MNIFIASVIDRTALLTSEESWHCAKVLRMKQGDAIKVIDGKGNFFTGVLELVSEKQCKVAITGGPETQPEKNYFLHLAIAPTKQIDRIEWMIEKAVEIGIDEISFMACKNSERTSVKTDRIVKIVESAVKQSLQAFIPKVNGMLPFKDIINNAREDQKLIAHCFETPRAEIRAIDFKNRSSLVLIGPEGDFTNEEVAHAQQSHFKPVRLGGNRLRTETAGLYVCQAVSLLT